MCETTSDSTPQTGQMAVLVLVLVISTLLRSFDPVLSLLVFSNSVEQRQSRSHLFYGVSGRSSRKRVPGRRFRRFALEPYLASISAVLISSSRSHTTCKELRTFTSIS